MASDAPLSDTAIAWIATSYSLLIRTDGAYVRSHALKSWRMARRRARSDLVAALSKSIFLPCGGLVLGEIESGSPTSCTTAVVLSTPALDAEGAAGAVWAAPTTKIVAATSAARRTPIPARIMLHSSYRLDGAASYALGRCPAMLTRLGNFGPLAT